MFTFGSFWHKKGSLYPFIPRAVQDHGSTLLDHGNGRNFLLVDTLGPIGMRVYPQAFTGYPSCGARLDHGSAQNVKGFTL